MGLDTVELVLDIEKEFNIHIDDNDAVGLGVLGDLARYIIIKVKDKHDQELSFEVVIRKLIHILETNYGIPKGYANSASHVVHDLGLD